MGGRRLLARPGYRLGLRDRTDQSRPLRLRTGPARTPGTATGRTTEAGRTRPARCGCGGAGAPSGGAVPVRRGAIRRAARRRSGPASGGLRPATGPGRRRPAYYGAGGGPTGCLRRRTGWPRRARWARWALAVPAVGRARARRSRRARRPAGQAQGRLVAALDVEEGARRHRQRVRGVHPRPGRRLLLPGQLGHDPDRARCQRPRPVHDRLLQQRHDGPRHDRHRATGRT